MEIRKIYVDMDGVLADFAGGVRDLCGLEPLSQDTKHRNPTKDDEMWERIRECDHFYGRLEPMPGAIDMFKCIYGIYKDRCEILTGVPKEERGIDQAADDKKEWVNKHISEGVQVNIVNWREKIGYCKGEGYVLIDDWKKIVRSWNEAGGVGILHVCTEETIEQLKKTGIL